MADQKIASEGEIHFTCQHCQASLSVAVSLAGVSGPCPSCGGYMTAPSAQEAAPIVMKPRKPGERKSSTKGEKVPRVPDRALKSEGGSTQGIQKGRTVSPDTGLSNSYKGRVEMIAIVKMLVAVLVVIVVVLVVTHYLKLRIL